MTTRIDARFAQLKKEGRSAFVTFLMAGDPDPGTSLAIVKAMPQAGADIIEIGMPFTDPMADGPSIQAAGQRDGSDRLGRRGRGRGRGRVAQQTLNPNVAAGDLDPLLRQLNMRGRGQREIIAFLQALDDPGFDRTVPGRVPSGLDVGGRLGPRTAA